MMTVYEYAGDMNKSVDEILSLCNSFNGYLGVSGYLCKKYSAVKCADFTCKSFCWQSLSVVCIYSAEKQNGYAEFKKISAIFVVCGFCNRV